VDFVEAGRLTGDSLLEGTVTSLSSIEFVLILSALSFDLEGNFLAINFSTLLIRFEGKSELGDVLLSSLSIRLGESKEVSMTEGVFTITSLNQVTSVLCTTDIRLSVIEWEIVVVLADLIHECETIEIIGSWLFIFLVSVSSIK